MREHDNEGPSGACLWVFISFIVGTLSIVFSVVYAMGD